MSRSRKPVDFIVIMFILSVLVSMPRLIEVATCKLVGKKLQWAWQTSRNSTESGPFLGVLASDRMFLHGSVTERKSQLLGISEAHVGSNSSMVEIHLVYDGLDLFQLRKRNRF